MFDLTPKPKRNLVQLNYGPVVVTIETNESLLPKHGYEVERLASAAQDLAANLQPKPEPEPESEG